MAALGCADCAVPADVRHADLSPRLRDRATFLSMSGAGSVVGALGIAALGNVKKQGSAALIMLICLGIGVSASRFPLRAFHLCRVVLRRGLHDGGLLHGEFAGATDCHKSDAGPRHERVQPFLPQRHADGNLVAGWLVPIFTAPIVLGVNGALLVFLGLYYFLVQRRVAEL